MGLKPLFLGARGLAAAWPGLIAVAAMTLAATMPAKAGPQIAFDMRTGAVLYGDDIDHPWYPASVTKLMTTYVALNAVREGRLKLETLLPASRNATAEPPSKIGIGLGQTITLSNALHILLVKSANDIAVVVAEGVSGSVPSFAAEMNATAKQIGMSRSHFVNPHGLPDAEQIVTARDMAILTRRLVLEYPEVLRMTRLPYVKIGQKTIRSYNPLIGRYGGADGMKTGFICAAGFNMVASATRSGQRVGAVVLGATSPDERRVAAENLLDLAFSVPRYDLKDRPTLKNVPIGPLDQPVNMRPTVCGGEGLPASDAPGLRAFDYSGPEISVSFGPKIEIVPLPKPRPRDLPEAEIVLASGTPDGETGDSKGAEPLKADPSIPLPRPRPLH